MKKITLDQLVITIQKLNKCDNVLNIDVTNSQPDFITIKCLSHSAMNSSYNGREVRIPNDSPYPLEPSRTYYYYFFVSVTNFCNMQIQLNISSASGRLLKTFLTIDQNIANDLIKNLGTPKALYFPIQSQGYFSHPVCMNSSVYKVLHFEVNFNGNYSLLFDARKMNRVQYLQEIVIRKNADGEDEPRCVDMWTGERIGVLASSEKEGVVVKIDGKNESRIFSIFTQDQDYDVEIDLYAICPDNCGFEEHRGRCLISQKKCVCSPGYGGDDCHLVCYYNRIWQVNNTDLCYYNAPGCDQYCRCESNLILKNHFCITPECLSGGTAPSDECIAFTEACLENCQCLVRGGFVGTSEKLCRAKLCGNGRIDKLYDSSDRYIRTEECDNGTNCNQYCRCDKGFYTNPADPLSCVKKQISLGELIGIVTGSVMMFVVIVIIISTTIFYVSSHKKIDINTFKLQQPMYHFYISGSLKRVPSKKSKYWMESLDLDFGTDNNVCEIGETRYQEIRAKNYSKKHMMIIFHTPNTKKFVFHFEPQVLHFSPYTKSKTTTVYMTLFCTTQIRDMNIPYTIWVSDSKSVLCEIKELLKNKSFETWSDDDEKKMLLLKRKVKSHLHYNLTIKTDAISSTQLDLDELDMSEKPIARGPTSDVYIGVYRSVPVAIKQFRWDDLTDEEIESLKTLIINECKTMSKLRNPFIANYMGSVTYVPQVLKVIQFFVLGSLTDYLRKENEFYIRFPYKLKIAMLYDISRGMQFLHENLIMHLDLKPNNLLVNSLDFNSACSIKIVDFGTSLFTKKLLKTGKNKELYSPIYEAPETFNDIYTFASDVFSFGITAWEIFYQEQPYKEFKNILDIVKQVQMGKRLEIDGNMPKLYRKVVNDCWQNDPFNRPNFECITKMIVAMNEDTNNYCELDNCKFDKKTEELIITRTERMKRMLHLEDKE
ncbi:serine-threonine protein kinase, putative [Entamoeba invadens IP1]|uniref:Serine-threonine protein kinase, putative n=1 Tax=Entamoeba invadens IP1 TaxID=370355 RepID=A0A0A1U1Y0_ENTIV|nr:serine-threonine protein kinase, putative [Entamoeba invadens IP1]ELP88024.1 serine-threonine protein kinase, putative [Entamoeba invadens IP1]|eukprot:XP_004254795.1 serine-threonine protein kinase, putative [Entamoeba invadens IP1]